MSLILLKHKTTIKITKMRKSNMARPAMPSRNKIKGGWGGGRDGFSLTHSKFKKPDFSPMREINPRSMSLSQCYQHFTSKCLLMCHKLC